MEVGCAGFAVEFLIEGPFFRLGIALIRSTAKV